MAVPDPPTLPSGRLSGVMEHSTSLRRVSRLAVVALMLAVSGGGSAVTAVPAAAPLCDSSVPGDVNGDGHGELAVGEPGNHRDDGSVHLFYGTANGLVYDASGTALNDQYFDQDSDGVPGISAKDDLFGDATVLGDFNGDGCSDLAVAAPGADARTGAITVLYGSPSGLSTTGAQRITPPTFAESLQTFGQHLATADLDGDGVPDLVATAGNLQTAHGKVVVLYGDARGLDRGKDLPTVLQGDSDGVGVEPIGFASGIATGDFDGNGRVELAVGQSAADDEGQVAILELGQSGFTRTGSLTLRAPGVPAAPQVYEGFGRQLAVGDMDADGRDDLAVGVFEPFCDSSCEDDFPGPGRSGDGAVAVFRGSGTGLSGRDAQLWTQDSPGVIGTSKKDGFGAAVTFGRLDTGTTADLLIGVPFDDVNGQADAGSVTALLGSKTGLTTAGASGASFNQDTPSIEGSAEEGDWFGETLSIISPSLSGPGAAVVGVPNEDVETLSSTGQIVQLALGTFGPKAVGSRTINADTAGVQGVSEGGDAFGHSLS